MMATIVQLVERDEGHLSASSSGSNDKQLQCSQIETGIRVLPSVMLLVGIGIMVALAFTKRRTTSGPQACCNGRPGLIYPLDVLFTSPYRLVYAAIFGIMSNTFIQIIFETNKSICGEESYNLGSAFCEIAIAPFITTMILCIFYAPLFMCVNPPSYPLLGHSLGLFYTVLLTISYGLQLGFVLKGCDTTFGSSVPERWATAMSNLPVYVFIVILLMWYSLHVILDIVHLSSPGEASESYQKRYVKFLLARNKNTAKRGRMTYWIMFILFYNKGFKYPLKFLGPAVVSITIMFKLVYIALHIAAISTIWYENTIKPSIKSTFDNTIDPEILRLIEGGLFIAPLAASGLCLFLLLHMFRSLHKDMQKLSRGEFQIQIKPESHYWKVAASLSYFGYQIGHFVWAWVMYYVVFLLITLLVFVIYFGFQYYNALAWIVFITPILTLIWLSVSKCFQVLICKYVFLDRKENLSKVIGIKHRNAFNWFAYFFFLYNAFIGLFGAILKVLLSMLFGILLLFRLDTNIMMSGFQFADRGHHSYRGFLYVEHTINNPIMNAFVAMLCDYSQAARGQCRSSSQIQYNVYESTYSTFPKDIPLLTPNKYTATGDVDKRRIRNRWLVAYTLVCNPSLRPLTGSRLKEQRRETLGGSDDSPIV